MDLNWWKHHKLLTAIAGFVGLMICGGIASLFPTASVPAPSSQPTPSDTWVMTTSPEPVVTSDAYTPSVAPSDAYTASAAPAEPIPTTAAEAPDAGGAVYYRDCAAVRAAGAAPLHRGDPGYSSKLDRDGDGIACEK